MVNAILSTVLLAAYVQATPVQKDEQHFVTGFAAFAEGNYQKTEYLWTRLADKGEARAQYGLAVLYELGRGVPQSFTRAVEWYEKAAENGYAMARNNLAMLYENGQGVPQDYERAAELYREAADQGLPSAQYNLGLMHYEGLGVSQDFTKAFAWLHRAADQGMASAQYNVGVMYHNGQGVSQDLVEAAKWYIQANKWGASRAETSLNLLISDKKRAIATPAVVVHIQPSDKSDEISQLGVGDTVYALKREGNWVGVLLNDRQTIGWVREDLIDLTKF